MNVGSLFSGIGGFDLGLERAGFKIAWQVENNTFCQKVLKRHWPNVPLYGDCTAFNPAILSYVDLICAGFPCQDLSVAGKRKGLKGEKSGLFWEVIRFAKTLRPKWVLIENVPGLLSSNDGRDFLTVLVALGELGYGVAWRILDSRYFGVAQRRRRVFIVGCLGEPCPPEIFFESEGLPRDTKTSQTEGSSVARPITTRSNRWKPDQETYVVCPTLRAGRAIGDSGGNPAQGIVIAPTLGASGAGTERSSQQGNDWQFCILEENTRDELRVRQSLPTVLNFGGKQKPWLIRKETNPSGMRETPGLPRQLDSSRYRALGNAVTVNVVEWIGRRILEVKE